MKNKPNRWRKYPWCQQYERGNEVISKTVHEDGWRHYPNLTVSSASTIHPTLRKAKQHADARQK